MYIVKRPAEILPHLLQTYEVEWHYQVGDHVKKEDLLAKISSSPLPKDDLKWIEFLSMVEKQEARTIAEKSVRYFRMLASEQEVSGLEPESEGKPLERVVWGIFSPVEGTLQQIFTPSTLSSTDTELALISTIPEPLDHIRIFYSYANEDERLRKELEKQLSVLRRQGFVVEWHKGDIKAGSEWQKQVDLYLNTAHIILMLVSPDFMASDTCYSSEMQQAIQRHQQNEARVIPILLRPSDWKGSPLGELQALPANAFPVTLWSNQDEAFLDVARGVRKVVQEMIESHLQHVQSMLVEEKEQRFRLVEREEALAKELQTKNAELQEFYRRNELIEQKRHRYQIIYDKIKIEGSRLEDIKKNLQAIKLIAELDDPPFLRIANLREGVNTVYGQFISELDILQQSLQLLHEEQDELEGKAVRLRWHVKPLQKQFERAALMSSAASAEVEELERLEQKASEMAAKIKF